MQTDAVVKTPVLKKFYGKKPQKSVDICQMSVESESCKDQNLMTR